MSLQFEVKVKKSDGSTVAQVRGITDRLHGGLGPDWAGPAISTELANIMRERFQTGGHGAWPPLMGTTVESRARRWGYYRNAPAPGATAARPILVWTGRLRDSLADPRGRGTRDAITRMSSTLLEQGTKTPYARYHMGAHGSRARRAPVELRPEDEERIAQVYREFVITGSG